MKFFSRSFPTLVSMLVSSGCVEHYPPPVSPPYPFEIKGYSIFIDDSPGFYDVIKIGDRTYCSFWKKMDDGDDLFIEDKKCDLHADRIVILSRDKIILAYDIVKLSKNEGQYLDYILQNHKKHIFDNDDAIIF